MLGYWDNDQEEDLEYLDMVDEQNKVNLKKVYDILPSLCKKQQLFINLCLKYSFNYERIAWHLGGISEYTVAHQIEQIINKLQTLLKKVENLDSPKLTTKIVNSCRGEKAVLRSPFDRH
jgi:DNA-directed RNA polymerase specialized sigma subunit